MSQIGRPNTYISPQEYAENQEKIAEAKRYLERITSENEAGRQRYEELEAQKRELLRKIAEGEEAKRVIQQMQSLQPNAAHGLLYGTQQESYQSVARIEEVQPGDNMYHNSPSNSQYQHNSSSSAQNLSPPQSSTSKNATTFYQPGTHHGAVNNPSIPLSHGTTTPTGHTPIYNQAGSSQQIHAPTATYPSQTGPHTSSGSAHPHYRPVYDTRGTNITQSYRQAPPNQPIPASKLPGSSGQNTNASETPPIIIQNKPEVVDRDGFPMTQLLDIPLAEIIRLKAMLTDFIAISAPNTHYKLHAHLFAWKDPTSVVWIYVPVGEEQVWRYRDLERFFTYQIFFADPRNKGFSTQALDARQTYRGTETSSTSQPVTSTMNDTTMHPSIQLGAPPPVVRGTAQSFSAVHMTVPIPAANNQQTDVHTPAAPPSAKVTVTEQGTVTATSAPSPAVVVPSGLTSPKRPLSQVDKKHLSKHIMLALGKRRLDSSRPSPEAGPPAKKHAPGTSQAIGSTSSPVVAPSRPPGATPSVSSHGANQVGRTAATSQGILARAAASAATIGAAGFVPGSAITSTSQPPVRYENFSNLNMNQRAPYPNTFASTQNTAAFPNSAISSTAYLQTMDSTRMRTLPLASQPPVNGMQSANIVRGPTPASVPTEANFVPPTKLTNQPANATSTVPSLTFASQLALAVSRNAARLPPRYHPPFSRNATPVQNAMSVSSNPPAVPANDKLSSTGGPPEHASTTQAGVQPKATFQNAQAGPSGGSSSKIPLFLPSPEPSSIARSVTPPSATSTSKPYGKMRQVYVLVPPRPQYLIEHKRRLAEKRVAHLEGDGTGAAHDEPIIVEDYNSGRSTPNVDGYEREAMRLSSSRIDVVPCRWDGCDAVMNSADAMLKHLSEHPPEPSPNNRYFTCRWTQCGRRCNYDEKHLEHHAFVPWRCAYKSCNDTFRSASQLAKHFRSKHRSGALKPSAELRVPNNVEPLPSVPGVVPAYLLVTKFVEPATISKARHNQLIPTVVSKIVDSDPERPASQRSRKTARSTGGMSIPPVNASCNDYDFITARSTRYSSYLSQPVDLALGDLDSANISKMIDEGLVLWTPEGGSEDGGGVHTPTAVTQTFDRGGIKIEDDGHSGPVESISGRGPTTGHIETEEDAVEGMLTRVSGLSTPRTYE